MPSLRRLPERLAGGAALLGLAAWRDRPTLAAYLARDLLHHVARLPVRQRDVSLTLDGLRVDAELFASQLGSFVDVLHRGVYDLVPGFRATPGQVVVDGGANIGSYALWQGRNVGPGGRVFAFEPGERAFRRLERNVAANRMTWVRCNHAALWSSAGEVTITADDRTSSTGKTSVSGPGERVPAVTLDQLVEREGLDRIDVVKLDTENAEAEIVRGGLDRALPITSRLVIESHNTRHQVRDLVEPLGFRCVHDGHRPNVVYFER